MEMEKRLGLGLQQGLQAFVQGGVTLGLSVFMWDEADLHRALDGFQQNVVLIQVHAVVGGLAVQIAVIRHVSEEAGKQDGLLHIVHCCAVAPQGQQHGASAELDIGRLHGCSRWVSG